VTRDYLGDTDVADLHPHNPDYLQRIELDVEQVEPQIACPPAIDNVKDLSAVEGLELDEVFIGSCTNGRIEDLAIVASFFKGQQVDPHTRTIVVPASKQVYMEALARGYIQTFMEAGALVMNAGCGPCLGRQHGVLGPGERALSTSNRNYAGRMGSPQAEIYLAKARTTEAGGSRLVVVKQILAELSSNARFAEAFVQEAKLAARLSHANVVQVLDLGRAPVAAGVRGSPSAGACRLRRAVARPGSPRTGSPGPPGSGFDAAAAAGWHTTET